MEPYHQAGMTCFEPSMSASGPKADFQERLVLARSGPTAHVLPNALRIAKGELWVERKGAALPLRPPAPDTRQPSDNPMLANRLRRTPLTPSSGDTTYPVPSIEVTAQEHDMNAPPNIDPVTAHSDRDVMHWLTNDTRDERFIDNIFAELCVRLQRAGIPVKRASLHILIHHPQ
jgi:hypothetical protein